jgi:methylmalonyl-CoA mutase
MSYRMTTERDPYVNMLRATAAAFAAGAGGADAVLLLPFNSCYAAPDSFARRMVRNAQLILQEEASLGRVADPAGGSYYVESLTHELARKSWDFFREIEACGGALAALDSGFVSRVLAGCAFRRNRNIAHSRDKLTGVSSYPNLDEQLVYTRPEDFAIDIHAIDEDTQVEPIPCSNRGKRFAGMVAAVTDGATLSGVENACKRVMERVEFVPGEQGRLAEPFEQLREASDLAMSRVTTRPPVFLANLGALADYTASASWARNFFAAGGIQTLDQGGFMKLEDLIRAFQNSPAPVACICVSENQLDRVKGVPAALREAGAAAIYFAGVSTLLPNLERSDRLLIDRIIYEGCNMLAVLTELHEVMGVRELGEAEPEEFDDDDQGALFAHRN